MNLPRHLLRGAAAGAAGTTALNVVTYADMVVRGRPASSTPTDTVEALSRRTGLRIPGDARRRANRLDGLGPLAGLAAGVGTGLVLGAARSAGWRPAGGSSFAAATVAALLVGNGPMTLLGITDPRTWDVDAWATDLLPHLAYGAATAYVLTGLDHDDDGPMKRPAAAGARRRQRASSSSSSLASDDAGTPARAAASKRR
jgi:hypothetical protein